MIPAEYLRQHDRLRYLLTLWLPEPVRGDMMTLGAWHVEIVSSLRKVHEPMLGHIRLQWWRETMAKLANKEQVAHPLAQALTKLMVRCHIPLAAFEAHIDACEMQAEQAASSVEEYFEMVASNTQPLVELTCHALGLAETDKQFAQTLATAYTIMVDLLSLAYPDASLLPSSLVFAYDQGDKKAFATLFSILSQQLSTPIPHGKCYRYLHLQRAFISYYLKQLILHQSDLRSYHYQRHYSGVMLRLGFTWLSHE